MTDWLKDQTAVDLAAHKTRHQDGGADEIDLTGLTAGTEAFATTANVATHAGLTGTHGAGTIASAANVSAHASSASGVHGAGTATIATTADITTHASAADPHTGYRLESADHSHQTTGAQAGQLDHGLALTGLTDDDHTQYQKESEKGAANGYASLGAGGLVPIAQLASGTADGTKYIRDDGTLAKPTGATAGDELILSANIEKTTTVVSYTKLKEIRLGKVGVFRIKFDAKGNPLHARIYRNGVAVGAEQVLTATYQTFSEDISGWSIGDLCQLYAKAA